MSCNENNPLSEDLLEERRSESGKSRVTIVLNFALSHGCRTVPGPSTKQVGVFKSSTSIRREKCLRV